MRIIKFTKIKKKVLKKNKMRYELRVSQSFIQEVLCAFIF